MVGPIFSRFSHPIKFKFDERFGEGLEMLLVLVGWGLVGFCELNNHLPRTAIFPTHCLSRSPCCYSRGIFIGMGLWGYLAGVREKKKRELND